MVGIHTATEDPLLASIDQMDLLGINQGHHDKSLNWLEHRAKSVFKLLHPDKLVNVPNTNALPYQAYHANAVLQFLRHGVTKGKSKEPATDLIHFRFWQHAAKDHRVRWQPFDEEGQAKSIHDTILRLPQATTTEPCKPSTTDTSHPVHAQHSWTGERERRPYGAARSDTDNQRQTSDNTTGEAADCDPSADDPLTTQDEQIRRITASFPLGKLFNLANHKDGRRFVFARTRLRKRAGENQKWALVAASIAKNGGLRLTLCSRDVNVRGNVVSQKLHQGVIISWERMVKGGFIGFGRFSNATKEDVLRFAMEQHTDTGLL